MIEIHLYGRFRQLADNPQTKADSIRVEPVRPGDRIRDVLNRLGIQATEVSHIFLNGEYSADSRLVHPGDRLGVFPTELALLYRQYFPKLTE